MFVLDLLSPCEEFYLLSPWVGDWQVLANRFGEFRSLLNSDVSDMRFNQFLNALSHRGSKIRIATKPDIVGNEEFLHTLSPKIDIRYDDRLHEKGIVTNRYYLRGSMNMTYSGVSVNEESVEISTDPETVLSALNESRAYWASLEP